MKKKRTAQKDEPGSNDRALGKFTNSKPSPVESTRVDLFKDKGKQHFTIENQKQQTERDTHHF